jgi:hypothetical protein
MIPRETEDIDESPEYDPSYGHRNWAAQTAHRYAPLEPCGTLHGNGADQMGRKMELDLRQQRRSLIPLDVQRFVERRQCSVVKRHVYDGAADGDDASGWCLG